MKKLLALLLAVSMVLTFAACAKETTEPTTDPTEPTTGTTEIVIDSDDPLYTKVSYTLANDMLMAQNSTVAATVGDSNLTVGQLQIYYWMSVYGFLNEYSYYLSYFGLDYTKPLDQQMCSEIDGTWQHYFLGNALNTWHNYQALALMAEKEGTKVEESLQKEIDSLADDWAKEAEEEGYDSVEALLHDRIAPGITFEDYQEYLMVYYTGYSYFQEQVDAIEVTNEMIEEYFEKNKDKLAESEITKESGKVVDVRHILVTPEGGTKDSSGNTTYSDAEWEACQEKAQALLDEWLAGEATEDTFAQMATKHTQDPGSKETGGLYENVYEGQMVEEFENWCFDESRKTGDYGLVKTPYGYHIMYFCEEEPEWIYYCRNAILDEKASDIVKAASELYTLTENYENIVLGTVDLAKSSS